jgi:hypothetical protein
MQHARHNDKRTASLYFEDAKTFQTEILKEPECVLKISTCPFSEILVNKGGESMKRLNRFQSNCTEVSSLKEAARLFVENNLGVPPSSSNYKNHRHLLELRDKVLA